MISYGIHSQASASSIKHDSNKCFGSLSVISLSLSLSLWRCLATCLLFLPLLALQNRKLAAVHQCQQILHIPWAVGVVKPVVLSSHKLRNVQAVSEHLNSLPTLLALHFDSLLALQDAFSHVEIKLQ